MCSYSHDKGYRAEAAVEAACREWFPDCYRPRAGRHADIGDIAGVPFVISVKDHTRMALASWCDDLTRMVAAVGSDYTTGVVWHKRSGRADPLNWYVTAPGKLWLPFMRAYCEMKEAQ